MQNRTHPPRTPCAPPTRTTARTYFLFFEDGSRLGEQYQAAASALLDDYPVPDDDLAALDATCQRMRSHIWRIRQARQRGTVGA